MNDMTFGLAPCISPTSTDVIIVGGGLSGTLTAIMLDRLGVHTALIDPSDVYPADFRAEQLVGSQVETLARLGLFDILIGNSMPAGRAVAHRAGRTVGVTMAPHYGIRYEDMVNRARRHLPASIQFIKAKVTDIDLAAGRQWVTLSNGSLVEGRLVVLSTGLGQRLLRKMGMGRSTIRDAQSLTFGFDIEIPSSPMFPDTVLVAYGERQTDRIDYLTIFAIENKLRANIFTYGNYRDAWTQRFKREPLVVLREAMPRIEEMTGRIEAAGPVEVRVNDLTVASGFRREGVVVVGDAFQTSCPAAGTGIGRLLNDIDRLCNYVPGWLSTEKVDVGKIAQFYDDTIKQRCDAEALRIAGYRRALTIETSLAWKLHRQRVKLQNRFVYFAQKRMLSAGQAETSWGGTGMVSMPVRQNSPEPAISEPA